MKTRNLNEKSYLILDSVGTLVNRKTAMTYPMYIDGTPDLEAEVPLSECTEEWWQSLSEDDDYNIREEFLTKIDLW